LGTKVHIIKYKNEYPPNIFSFLRKIANFAAEIEEKTT